MRNTCLILAVFLLLTSCGSRKVHIEEYKSGAIVQKVSETKSESKTTNETEKLTNIVNQYESNEFEIVADEIVIEDNQGNKKTFKNAVISSKKNKSDTNVVKSEKVAETSESRAESKVSKVSEFEQSEKVRDTDRKQFNFTLLITQIFVALAILACAYWLYRKIKRSI